MLRTLAKMLPAGVTTRRGSRLKLAELGRASRSRRYAMIRDRCANAHLGDGTSLCRVLGRYKMYVDTTDRGLSSHLLLDGIWEIWMVEALLERIKPGMTVVDAGANLGYFTLLMADLVGDAGHVHAFEPNPPIAGLLRASIAINGFLSRTTVHEFGLSDRSGGAAIAIPTGEPKNAHIIDDVHRAGAVGVEVRRLDQIEAIGDVDFIKIDVEGSEERLWSGMAGLLARGRPLTILLEFTGARYPDAAAFLDRMLGEGFRLQHLTLDRGVQPLTTAELLALPGGEDQMILLTR